jgi:hypothetical protein
MRSGFCSRQQMYACKPLRLCSGKSIFPDHKNKRPGGPAGNGFAHTGLLPDESVALQIGHFQETGVTGLHYRKLQVCIQKFCGCNISSYDVIEVMPPYPVLTLLPHTMRFRLSVVPGGFVIPVEVIATTTVFSCITTLCQQGHCT